ncbi:MAG: YibE/F family protein [Candidatus Faecousia sp.]|uniref:YibE/F family protein n=1 Tax=Faecousia sp. TaxID=2952921 RepID=UPI002A8A3FBE|nr:YibE/F family protein [Candidatus Faecousia sp.]
MKQKFSGRTLAYLILGVAFALVGIALTVVSCAAETFHILALLCSISVTLGGVTLALLALRDRRLAAQELPAELKKSVRQTAPAPASPLEQKKRSSLNMMRSALVLLLCGLIFFAAYQEALKTPSTPSSSVQSGVIYEKAKVIAITGGAYQGDQDMEDVPVGKQELTAELISGDYKGQRFSLTNNLSYLYGTVLKEGDTITVAFSLTDGKVENVVLQDYDRTVPLAVIVLLFLLVTILVGGKVGAKSLLGLGLTILCVFVILIPLLLDGWPTLPTVLALCAFVTVITFVVLGGVNRKTVCAILGTIMGVAMAMAFGKFACWLLRIDGYKMYVAVPTVEPLLQLRQTQDPAHALRLADLLVGGILLAALGAVNDVAMSISSAMNELIAVNPSLTRRQLFKSGMNIGRDMVGTMTNTLILALVGGSFAMIIYYTSMEPSWVQLMSTTFLSVEMVQALASSIGVILAVPFSVVIGMLLFGMRPKKAKKEK